MPNYIDGFILPVPRIHLNEYKSVAEQVAEVVDLKGDEVVVFGWVVFPSKEIRDSANQQVPNDPRMAELVGPLTNPERLIFDANRMIYGGFEPLVESDNSEAE